MPATLRSAQLNNALSRFESKLDPKVASGSQEEVQQWAEQIGESFTTLDDFLGEQRRRVHEKLFKEVGEHDPCELPHIRDLKEADEKVEQLLDIVKTQIIVLGVQSATEVEPRVDHHALSEESVLEIIDRGAELVHWIRDQEAAVSIWFAETFAE